MQFLTRTFAALRYHRRAYLAEFGFVLLLCAASIVTLTVRAQGLGMRQNFSDRLAQFTPSAVSKAGQLVSSVKATYGQLDVRILWTWAALIAGTALVSFVLALVFAHRRREESLAYMLVGKPTGAILGQYLLEGLIVALAAFLGIWLLCLLFGTTVADWLGHLTRTTFNDQLKGTLTDGTVARDLNQLMHQHVTTFSGPGLLAPNQPLGPKPALALSGEVWTLAAVVGATTVGQAAAWLCQLTHQRFRLRHPRQAA
ncbi:hypothetical protein [Lacticaseibacillus kribbianus]|uniref:hypothetical protein n=1 Tax=Lacticaseibacillus kribbianus TaxID=2926292 RepID=UPI001CD440CE|nr:hypothetical protein [Lacticaseibacillus kribbianus]